MHVQEDVQLSSKKRPGVSKTRSEDSMQRAVTTGDCSLEARHFEAQIEGPMQSAMMTEDCSLEEVKKKMQDHHAASGSLKEGEEDNFQRQVKKVHVLDEIGGQRTMDTEGKLDMKGCELVEKKHLLAVEQKLKLAEEEIQMYKLEEICRQRQAEEYTRQGPISGGPYTLHPPLRGKEHTVTSSCFISAAKAAEWVALAEKAQDSSGTLHAGGPQPFRGPARVAFPVSGPSSSSWPPAPGPPLCPVQPCPPPASALLSHPVGRRSPTFPRTNPRGLPRERPVVAQLGTCTWSLLGPCATSPPTASCSARSLWIPEILVLLQDHLVCLTAWAAQRHFSEAIRHLHPHHPCGLCGLSHRHPHCH
ncbi:hypothetical protein CB1_000990002 [Camelus ferus]|nr:hypothetical protein CB1_000990002 [Camelus ferus]